MKKNRLSLAFLSLLIAASPLRAQDTLQNETVEQKDKRMEWFSQAKLGIFIHWGIYSVRGEAAISRLRNANDNRFFFIYNRFD